MDSEEEMHESCAMLPQDAQDAVFGNSDLMSTAMQSLTQYDRARLACVSRAWKIASESPEFWKHLQFEGKLVEPERAIRMLEAHRQVVSIDLRNMRLHNSVHVSLMFSLLPRLVELVVGGRQNEEAACIWDATGHMPCLRTWTIVEALTGGLTVRHDRLGSLAMVRCHSRGYTLVACPNLTSLVLQASSFQHLMIECPHLTHLEMTDGSYLSRVAFASLRSLDLSRNTSVHDSTLWQVLTGCTALTRLVAKECCELSLNSIMGVAFHNLRHADFSDCLGLDAEKLARTLQCFPNLDTLILERCHTIPKLTLHMHDLRVISLAGCLSLSEISLNCPNLEHAELGTLSRSPLMLKRASLASNRLTHLCWRGISALEHVVLDCPRIMELDLSCCECLQDSVFSAFGGPPRAHRLGESIVGAPCTARILRLDNCFALRHAVVASDCLEEVSFSGCKELLSLRVQGPALERLALSECNLLTRLEATTPRVTQLSLGTCPALVALQLTAVALSDLDMRACGHLEDMKLHCPRLAALDCSYCQSLSDWGLGSLVDGCSRLDTLSLSVCPRVGLPGLRCLQRLGSLRKLDLSYTDLQENELRTVVACCPKLQELKLLQCKSLPSDSLSSLLPLGGRDQQSFAASVLDLSYCDLPSTPAIATVLLGCTHLKEVEVNGCHGFSDGICQLLHQSRGTQGGASEAQEGQANAGLAELSAKGCKNLTAFWLGAPPLDRPSAKQPYDYPELGKAALQFQPWQPAWLYNPLPGLKKLKLGMSAIRSLTLALPQLQVLDTNTCTDLWRLQLSCPALKEANFQACSALSADTILEQLTPCLHLERVNSVYPALEGEILAVIGSNWGSITPPHSASSSGMAVSAISWGSVNSGLF